MASCRQLQSCSGHQYSLEKPKNCVLASVLPDARGLDIIVATVPGSGTPKNVCTLRQQQLQAANHLQSCEN